jgi:hypothetical protein
LIQSFFIARHANTTIVKLLKRALVAIGVLIVVAVAVIGGAAFVESEPMPEHGVTGEAADALAHQLERAMNKDAWDKTGAVEWRHGGRSRHLWDRKRGFDRVRWKDFEVLLDIGRQEGIATKSGQPLNGAEKDKAVKKAYALWANDSFWVAPLSKLFDEGVTREKVEVPERDRGIAETGLLVKYASGGVTPGDAYLWLVPKDGLPPAWRMWVSILPVHGIKVTWDNWQPIDTGAMVSRHHQLSAIKFDVDEMRAAATLEELTKGADPFAALVAPTPASESAASAR